MALGALLAGACSAAGTTASPSPATEPVLTLLPVGLSSSGQAESDAAVAPAATAGPTPTPQIHVLQAGDTLLALAIRYGVSVEALQAANPGVNPAAMQPGAQLVIPRADVEPTPGFLPTPTPLPVTLAPITCAPTPAGGQLCLAEIQNSGSSAVTNVAVQINLLAASGDTGPVAVAYAPLEVVRSGGRAPLAAFFTEPFDAERLPVGLVLAAEDAGELAGGVVDLSVGEIDGAPAAAGGFEVTGQLVNEYADAVTDIQVVVTLYGSSGAVTGYRSQQIDGPLAPAAGVSFGVLFTNPDAAAEIAVVAQGRLAHSLP
ncbi:MAG: FxLYD domain-containing protein [Anaerolineales bacterium]